MVSEPAAEYGGPHTGWHRKGEHTMFRMILILASGLCPMGQAVADYTTGMERLESEHELSMEYETPHTKWAKPYAQGSTRVLYICPYFQGSTEGREIIELMQRFDLEADAIYFQKGPNRLLGDGNPRWYVTDKVGTERALRLLETPYDVIFLNRVTLTELNDAVREVLKVAVQRGTGLVYVGEEGEWGTEDFTPLEKEPTGIWKKAVYTYGRGRVIDTGSRAALPFVHGWETRFDYQLAEQGKALLWAANRSPEGKLFLMTPDMEVGARFPQRLSGSPPVDSNPNDGMVRLEWAAGPAGSKIDVFLRVPYARPEQLITVDASNAGQIPVPIPYLRAGTHGVDAFLRSDRGIEAWTSTTLIFETPYTIGELGLRRDWAEPGERIEGAAQLVEMRAGDTVAVRVFDAADRKLLERPADLDASGLATFAVDVPDWFPMLVRVETALLNGAQEISASHAYVRITKRKQNQFNLIMWNVPSGDLAPYGIERMAELGVTTVLQGGPPHIALSASELTYVPYAASFRASSHTVTAMLDEKGILKTGCVHDEETMAKQVADAVTRAQEARQHGTFVYSLGDENAVRASCLGPHCLRAYRGYLEDIYGNIKALNASWDASYANFDDITLLEDTALHAEDAPRWFKEYFAQRTLKNETDSHTTGEEQLRMGDINDEIRALQAGNYARWYDRQAFQSWSYVQWCKRFVKAFREIDPQSLTGFEGTDSFSIRRLTTRSRQGGDLDLFMREMEYFGPYRGPANEVTRSLAKPGFPAGNWIGYSRDADVLLMNYWKQVIDNFSAVQWWRWDNMGEEYQPFLAPTFSPIGAGKEFVEDTHIIREGLGDLLMHYTMETHGIAMLYSMPSTHIAHFDGNRSYGKLKRDHGRWHKAIQNAGLEFDYVTDRMLRLGEFDMDKYKVLILPLAFALGEKEAAVIREFAAQGGTVIADVRPGLYSDRCKTYEDGILDEFFGVKRTGKQDAMKVDRLRVQGALNETDLYMEWGNWYGKDVYPQMHVDPTVELSSGEALGWAFPIHYHGGLKHPLAIVNKHGKGQAVLLNFAIYHAPFDDLLRELLAASGVIPEITIADAAGKHPAGVEITHWKDGDTEILALLGNYTGEVTVNMPDVRHVYNIKTGETLGKGAAFDVNLKKARAVFYALLPEKGIAPAITLTSERTAPGDVLTAKVRTPHRSSTSAVGLRLLNPEGEEASWISRKAVLEDGRGAIDLPFALNDPTGNWTLEVLDLLTGHKKETQVSVR
jgi:hypothetical protein